MKEPSSETPETEQKLCTSDFECITVIGKGTFGTVYQVRKKSNRRILALKFIAKPSNSFEQQRLENEKKILGTVKHPFICECFDIFESDTQVFFVLEFMIGGEFYNQMKRVFTKYEAHFYMAQTVLAIEYLHDNNILYRDLKASNIMISKNGYLRLVDFGLSKCNFTEGSTTRTCCGTLIYMAPEILNREPYGRAVDVWAMGVLMFGMIFGAPPYEEGPFAKALDDFVKDMPFVLPQKYNGSTTRLLKKLLKSKPEERATIANIKNSSFFKTVNWNKIKKQKYTPPFIPAINGDLDLTYFEDYYTNISIDETWAEKAEPVADPFANFDWVNLLEEIKPVKPHPPVFSDMYG